MNRFCIISGVVTIAVIVFEQSHSLAFDGNSAASCGEMDSSFEEPGHFAGPELLKTISDEAFTALYPSISKLAQAAGGGFTVQETREVLAEFHHSLLEYAWYKNAIETKNVRFFNALIEHDSKPGLRLIGVIGMNDLAPNDLTESVIRALRSPLPLAEPVQSIPYSMYFFLFSPWLTDSEVAKDSASEISEMVARRSIDTADLLVIMSTAGPEFIKQIVKIITAVDQEKANINTDDLYREWPSYTRDALLAWHVLLRVDLAIVDSELRAILNETINRAGDLSSVCRLMRAAVLNDRSDDDAMNDVAIAIAEPVSVEYYKTMIDMVFSALAEERPGLWSQLGTIPVTSISEGYRGRLRAAGVVFDE